MTEPFDLLIRNGVCATPSGLASVDIGVRAGRVAELGALSGAAAVETFDADQRIGDRRLEAGDADRAAAQPAGAPNRPALGEGVVVKRGPRCAQVLAARWQFRIQREPKVFAPPWHLPQRRVGLGADLAQFEIGRTHFVRE